MQNDQFPSMIGTQRPIRLTQETRHWAGLSLDGLYGRDARTTPYISLDDIPGISKMSDLARYDAAIMAIAQHAPIRLVEGERISGSATLGSAIDHEVPGYFDGKTVALSVSHLTCGFDKALRVGIHAYEDQIRQRLLHPCDSNQEMFLNSCLNAVAALRAWHSRYLESLAQRIALEHNEDIKQRWQKTYENLMVVPFSPPENFHQAVQAIWFLFAFIRLCGNWPGIGRLDYIWGPLLKNDLDKNTITIEEARELIAHFFIKGCEWICQQEVKSGDAQHYQNIVLGGIDEQGNDICNEATQLILEVVEELNIGDYPIAVRVNDQTPPHILRKMAEVTRYGGGIVAIYNENLILKSIQDFGYPFEEAWQFANDGCWEIQIPGKTNFMYRPFDGFDVLQNKVLQIAGDQPIDFNSFEQLYQTFIAGLDETIEGIMTDLDHHATEQRPATVVSLFTEDCIENGRGYYDRGARYNVHAVHLGGLPDIANSLYAIRKLVYEEKRVTMPQLIEILRNNWAGEEALRRYVLNAYTYFGNDSDEVDELACRIYDDYIAICNKTPQRNGVLRPAGISTYGRQIDWKDQRGASAHGHFGGDILAGNLSPTPGTDQQGATAIIKSHCKFNLEKLPCGTALDIKLFPTSAEGEAGLAAIESLYKGFIKLGGFFMQIDVIDNSVLLDAQQEPEKYQHLCVRVSGWSARFITLSKDWQDMIIQRSGQVV